MGSCLVEHTNRFHDNMRIKNQMDSFPAVQSALSVEPEGSQIEVNSSYNFGIDRVVMANHDSEGAVIF